MSDCSWALVFCRPEHRVWFEKGGFVEDPSERPSELAGAVALVNEHADDGERIRLFHTVAARGIPFFAVHRAGGSYPGGRYACDGKTVVWVDCGFYGHQPVVEVGPDGALDTRAMEKIKEYYAVLAAAEAALSAPTQVQGIDPLRPSLYLDDERVEPEGWFRVTTAQHCIALLSAYQNAHGAGLSGFDALSLDHDLDETISPMTGYDVACWLEQQAAAGNWGAIPRVLQCHSDNPVGRARIIQTFTSIQRLRSELGTAMERFLTENGIVTDTKTGLQWEADHHGPMMWDEAQKYAKALRLGGHEDWRVPTIEELITLIDFSRDCPASAFPGMPSDRFWSCSGSSSYAWGVYFVSGYVNSYGKSNSYYVRCVRCGPVDPSGSRPLDREVTK